MFDPMQLMIFLVTATALAVSPGPGMLYVAARSISGGRAEGLASSFGPAAALTTVWVSARRHPMPKSRLPITRQSRPCIPTISRR